MAAPDKEPAGRVHDQTPNPPGRGESLTPDAKADVIIAGMASAGVVMGLVPAPMGAPFIATVAGGVVAIGRCYGVGLTQEEAGRLIREFFHAAGYTLAAIKTGTELIGAVGKASVLGYPVAAALDAAGSAALAYAVGTAAKAHFSGNDDPRELGAVMRQALRSRTTRLRGAFDADGRMLVLRTGAREAQQYVQAIRARLSELRNPQKGAS